MSKSPYLDKVQTGRLWEKIKALTSALETADAATASDVATLVSRVDLLYLKYQTNVDGNCFNVSFTTLDGLAVTGVWNSTEGRMEF